MALHRATIRAFPSVLLSAERFDAEFQPKEEQREIESLSNCGISFIREEYLPRKLWQKDWLA